MGSSMSSSYHEFDSSETNNCNIYTNYRKNRNTSFLGLAGYEGIPQNLVLNLMGWLVLHMLFICLRKKAWNYGRLAVMQKDEIKWTDMFYGAYNDEDVGSIQSNQEVAAILPAGVAPKVAASGEPVAIVTDSPDEFSSSALVPNGIVELAHALNMAFEQEKHRSRASNPKLEPTSDMEATGNGQRNSFGISSNQNIQVVSEIKDSGYFAWIRTVYKLTYNNTPIDEQYREKCGQDCVFYLSFQRHLILLAFIITVCSLGIIMPINMHRPAVNVSEFERTTIRNLGSDQNFIWAHIILAISFLFVSIYVMRRFSKGLQFTQEEDSETSRTVIIIGLNKNYCHENLIRDHFAQTYPTAEITEVSFGYNISKLQRLEFRRLKSTSAKLYFMDRLEKDKRRDEERGVPWSGNRPQMRPYNCGVFGCCCRSCKKTDAIEYYTSQEKDYADQLEAERRRVINNPMNLVFVTFKTVESAERLVDDYACAPRIFLNTPASQYSKQLSSTKWVVVYAPPPDDIKWESLSLDYKMWYVKFIIINFVLAAISVVFTTPVYLFALFVGPVENEADMKSRPILFFFNASSPFASAIVDTLPTIIIWILGLTLISIVYKSDYIVGYWTKSAENLSEMIKIFLFLTFMVIILPSLGVTSFSFFFNQRRTVSWSCIFYKENGALFVNYICTSSLIGTAAELMRIPELFVYVVKLSFAKSRAEIGAIRKSVLWDFQMGASYAWIMLHFAIFTCFSVIYPLVTPFGFLYLCLKHWTDRYNLYFAYNSCKVDKNVHGTAVNFVIMCMFMLQINLLAFVHTELNAVTVTSQKGRTIETKPEARALQVFSLLGFSITAALFLGQLCFNVCTDFSPIQHYKSVSSEGGEEAVIEEGGESQPELQQGESGIEEHPLHKQISTTQLLPSNRIPGSSRKRQSRTRSSPEMQVESNSGSPSRPFSVSRKSLHDHRSESVGSNQSTNNKSYGLYIPPLLRAEFVRMAGRHKISRSPSPTDHRRLN